MHKKWFYLVVAVVLSGCGATPAPEPYGDRLPINSEETRAYVQKLIKDPDSADRYGTRRNFRFGYEELEEEQKKEDAARH